MSYMLAPADLDDTEMAQKTGYTLALAQVAQKTGYMLAPADLDDTEMAPKTGYMLA